MFKKIFMLVFVLFCLFACSSEEDKENKVESKPQLKRDLSLKLSDGKDFNLSYKSDELLTLPDKKPLLLLFFTRSCLPCTAQIDVLNQLKKEFLNLEIIGVLLEDKVTKAELDKFIKAKKVGYLIANSKDNQILAKNLGRIEDIPAIYLYKNSGKLFASYTGLMPLEMLRTALINMDNN